MPRSSAIAKPTRRDPAVLPDNVCLGAHTLERLRVAGLVALLEGWLPLSRNGGYTVTPLFAAVVVYLLAGTGGGFQRFLRELDHGVRRRLAAVVRLRSLPSASAGSRTLGDLDSASVRSFLDRLLPAPIAGTDIFSHPGVHHLDANGQELQVVDVDPTVRARRKRELPAGEDRFEGKRRCAGEPGYVGRHRGEVRMRTVPAIHDGSGLWLAVRLLEQEGSIVPVFQELVERSLAVLGKEGVTADQVLFRGDGEFGSTLALKTPVARGTHVLARIARYNLLKREEVEAHIETATWYPVRSGESGVPREAAELGLVELVGSTGESVQLRVVMCRIPVSSEEKTEEDYGFRRGLYRIELFATDLDPHRWPAPDLIELFNGRSSIENRFLQEDRELNLGHTVSENPAGQEFTIGVGLFLWNEQVCTGWRKRPPALVPRRQERRPRAEPLCPDRSHDAPGTPTNTIEVEDLPVERESALVPALDPVPVGVAPRSDASAPATLDMLKAANVVPEEVVGAPSAEPNANVADARAALGAVLVRAFGDLGRRDGWSIEPQSGVVRCPNRRMLIPFHVAQPTSGAPRLSVRTESHACLGCPFRPACFPVDRRFPYKQVSRAITPEERDSARSALAALRGTDPPLTRASPHRPPSAAAPLSEPVPVRPLYQPPVPAEPGPWFAERPVFLPATARRRALLPRGYVIRVELDDVVPPRPARTDPVLANGRDDRAHRRRTRSEIVSKNRHHPATRVTATVQRRESD